MPRKRPQKSYYYPKNPEKYKGNPNNIVCRSSWERIFCRWCDLNPNVKWWQSEEHPLWYKWKDGTPHRYFPDFVITFQDNRIWMIEIKPKSQTLPPKEIKTKSKKRIATFINEIKEYQKNLAKWDAAKKWCDSKGWTFKIITEVELNVLC